MKESKQYNRRFRACMNCGALKPVVLLKNEGCHNCPLLSIKKSAKGLSECTSESYRGLIGMLDSRESWVAKWQRIPNYSNGLYAITVEGELPEHYIESLEAAGKTHVPRNRPFRL